MTQSPSTASAASAEPLAPCTAPRYTVSASEYAIASAWAPANAIEEHLVRKIGGLGVTIENLLNHLTTLDPADPEQAKRISQFSLSVSRLQKTQTALEADLREIQSQRGIRATHPLICEPIPAQADARPYVCEPGIKPPVFTPSEPLLAPDNLSDESRAILEAHYGTRIKDAAEWHDGRMVVTPKLIDRLTAAARQSAAAPTPMQQTAGS